MSASILKSCDRQGVTANIKESEENDMEQWVNFYDQDGRFLFGYTLQGTFAGEMQATKELLAAENGCCPENIRVKVANGKEEDQNMTTLMKAMATLDGVIPPPGNAMVDHDHLPIAAAWQECKRALVSYDDMQDRHDTLMRRWGEMVETIRKKIDAGTLTQEDRRLLNDLHLPHIYDRRPATGIGEPGRGCNSPQSRV
jgi:hypothetical protein